MSLEPVTCAAGHSCIGATCNASAGLGADWADYRWGLRCQLGAAFCAAALEDEAPGFCRHASTKPVGSCALEGAGLECAFHDLNT